MPMSSHTDAAVNAPTLATARSTPPPNRQGEPTGEILVVDDDAGSRTVFEDMLSACGHRVTIVDSAAEAQRLALAKHFDLILIDVFLADRDVIDLTRAM